MQLRKVALSVAALAPHPPPGAGGRASRPHLPKRKRRAGGDLRLVASKVACASAHAVFPIRSSYVTHFLGSTRPLAFFPGPTVRHRPRRPHGLRCTGPARRVPHHHDSPHAARRAAAQSLRRKGSSLSAPRAAAWTRARGAGQDRRPAHQGVDPPGAAPPSPRPQGPWRKRARPRLAHRQRGRQGPPRAERLRGR